MNGMTRMGRGFALVTAWLSLFSGTQLRAHTYVVTDTNDTTAVTSLRGAVIAANARGGENTIVLGEEFDPRRHRQPQAWTFNLSIYGPNETAAQTGDLDVTAGKLTIIGAARSVTVNATGLNDRVFHIWPGAHLTLENLIITGGTKPFPLNPGGGGGIIIVGIGGTIPPLNPIMPILPIGITNTPIPITPIGPTPITNGTIPPTLPITQPPEPPGGVVIVGPPGTPIINPFAPTSPVTPIDIGAIRQQGNGALSDPVPILPPTPVAASARAVGGNNSGNALNGGGAILNAGTTVLRNCVVAGNSTFADDGGGGILNAASMVLENCAITNNSTTGGNGGGIFNSGSLELVDCYIADNVNNFGDGGAIYNSGKLKVVACLIKNNSMGIASGGNGGGIYNDEGGELKVEATTILSNRCASNSQGVVVAGYLITRGGSGGGVYNAGSLKLDQCRVSGNTCGSGSLAPVLGQIVASAGDGGGGGGIFNQGESILNDCMIGENSAGTGGEPNGIGGNGGGINNLGTLTMRFCTVSGNAAGSGGGGGAGGAGGNGGGICSTNALTIVACTISGNSAGPGGNSGADFSHGGLGEMGGTGGSGGGIYSAGDLELTSATVVANAAGTGGPGGLSAVFPATNGTGGMGGSAGGIYQSPGTAATEIRNSLIALNRMGDGGAGGQNSAYTNSGIIFIGLTNAPGSPGLPGSDPDVGGAFTSRGFNLIGKVDGSSGFVNGVGADQVGSIAAPLDPRIGPLEMNGGPTATFALLSGSPAIDKGKSFGIHEDQRGRQRPYNYSGIPNAAGGDGSDIGAFELDARDRH